MRKETTPGPWKLDRVWMLIKGPNREEVCAIHAGAADGTSQRVQRSIAYANAQLIASAPELLELTERRVLVFLSALMEEWPKERPVSVESILTQARQAIAKARGER